MRVPVIKCHIHESKVVQSFLSTEHHYHRTCDVMYILTSSMNDVLRKRPTTRPLALEGWFEKPKHRLFGHVRVKELNIQTRARACNKTSYRG